MKLKGISALVTGGASGLGRASAEQLLDAGAKVVILDLPGSPGHAVAAELGENCRFAPGDVTNSEEVSAAIALAQEFGALRGVVHCAGRGGTVRVVEKDGSAGSLELYETIVRVNLIGSFNVLRLSAEAMAKNDPVEDERGVVVLTASIAAFEGQIGQIPYASAKAGIVGMTLVAARDLARQAIRVCTIAPGVFDTPILDRLGQEIKDRLGAGIPNPSRLGRPEEFAMLARHIIENPMINGETIRIDGAMRMAPR